MSIESSEFSMQEQTTTKSSLVRLRHNVLLLNGRSDQHSEISELLNGRLGYHVLNAEAKAETLGDAQLKLLKPDAVIIDAASVPHSRQMVKSLSVSLPDTAIIVLVGYGEFQEAQEYLMLGAHDFITKPFAQERISVTLRNALALQDARREIRDMLQMSQLPQGENGQAGEEKFVISAGSILSFVNANGDVRKLHEVESALIRFAIAFYKGRISTVSRKLGVGRSTLYRKLASLDRS